MKKKKILEKDLANIIKFFEKINELDLSNVEPLFHPLPQGRLRKDVPRDPLDRENALKNVKRKEDGYIVGPRTYGE